MSPVQKENSFMGMRRLFIIRKDLHLSAGKLGAMVAHCAEGYWIWLIKRNLKEENGRVHASFDLDREIYDDYLNGRITKTICGRYLQFCKSGFQKDLYSRLDA